MSKTTALLIVGAVAVVGVILLRRRGALPFGAGLTVPAQSGGASVYGQYVNPAGYPGYAYNGPTLLAPPPPPPPAPPVVPNQSITNSTNAKSGGFLKSTCQKAFNMNGQLISTLPNKNAKTVAEINNIVGDINCGAVGLVEKGAGAVVKGVGSAAKSIGHALSSIF